MALITMDDCSVYFECRVVPRLRREFPNLEIEYMQGKSFGQIKFERTRRYKGFRKYNEIFIWVNPRPQGNHADIRMIHPIISGRLQLLDSPRGREFRWDDLDVMIREICKLESEPNKCCKVCVVM